MRFKKYIKESVIGPDVTILEYPEFRQTYSFDCGASALHSIITYYGIDEQEAQIMKLLNLSEDGNGADIPDLIRVAEFYGIETDSRENMSIVDIINSIDNKWPVMVEVQSTPDNPYDMSWRESNEFGHYCVAIGYDKNNIYFEDPLSIKRTYLTYKEFVERWHGWGTNDKIYNKWGMICKGVPAFKINDVTHFE